jgi:murein DD-endopeptidase MepM/ murein hydrolase activator NlpD
MPSRPNPPPATPPRYASGPVRAAVRPPHPHAARQAPKASYVIAHAGRQVRFGPVVFWIVVGSIVLMGGWSAATATYFTFRDDVLTRLIARQAQVQYAYEDRIAELRARIDRTTSKQMLDQEQFSRKLDQIMRRQATLESRATAMSALPDLAPTGSIKPPARGISFQEPPAAPKPSPISDTVTFVAPPDREARLQSRTVATRDGAAPHGAGTKETDDVIARLQTSLDRVEQRQFATLASAEEHYETRARRMRAVLGDLGLGGAHLRAPAPRGVGGPFVPVKVGSGTFERQLSRVSATRAQAERLTSLLANVPYRKPVVGPVEFSSGFGVRTDPFLGRPAMHTGLDFRASTGEPARATANGKVVKAGWHGGYGRMVEIDHGNGLTTRYGHLSAIRVKIGESVRIGQTIGDVGSTGRSTAPHLHYETRIDGDAVDPQRFLRAGVKLAAG